MSLRRKVIANVPYLIIFALWKHWVSFKKYLSKNIEAFFKRYFLFDKKRYS